MNTSLRTLGIALALSILPATALHAQVSVGIQIGLPGVQIGVNMPSYPTLVAVPGYPVYYDPQASANYFFYDGLYWVYTDDNWYASSWYNGPWELTSRDYVLEQIRGLDGDFASSEPPHHAGARVGLMPRVHRRRSARGGAQGDARHREGRIGLRGDEQHHRLHERTHLQTVPVPHTHATRRGQFARFGNDVRRIGLAVDSDPRGEWGPRHFVRPRQRVALERGT